MKKTITKYILTIIALSFVLASCNIDSHYGVLQQKFNASASDAIPVETVLGVDSKDNIIFVSRGDIYSTDGLKDTKIAEMTKYNNRNLRINPVFTKDDVIYLTWKDNKDTASTADDRYDFFYATAEERDQDQVNKEFIEERIISVTLPEGTELSDISTPSNFNLDRTYFLYTTPEDNTDSATPDDNIKHYGFIERDSVNTSSLTITGGVAVHEAATIFGDRAVRVYTDGSDKGYKNQNHFYLINNEGTAIEDDHPFSRGDYDNLPMGCDGEYVITLDGDMYNIETERTTDLVNDLIYRVNDMMPVYDNGNGDKIGYLYRGGIYFNPAGADTAPYVIEISDDNDLITSAWIGMKDNSYLMVTQENGIWVVTLEEGTNRYSGSIHEFSAEDGAISEYLK